MVSVASLASEVVVSHLYKKQKNKEMLKDESDMVKSIVFFKVYDECVGLFEDAETCSKVCGLTVVQQIIDDEPIERVNIPYWLFPKYTRQLLRAGYQINVVEKVEIQTATGKTIAREITRRIKPTTSISI